MSNIYRKPNILIVGLAGQSVFLKCERFHEKGETIHCSGIHTEPGGKGMNQAVAAKRLGGCVTFAYAAGNDADAEICENFLHREGIRSICFRKKDMHTAYASILTDTAGENRVSVYPGASACLSEQDVYALEPEIERCDWMLLQLEIPFAATQVLVQTAKKWNVPVILNPAPAIPLSEDFLKDIFLITPNEQEYRTVKKTPAIVTLGSEGCIVAEAEKHTKIPSVKTSAVDTTGAGDVFNGALAVQLARGENLISAARFAVAASGLSVQHAYVMNGIPTEEKVKEMMMHG